MKTNEQLDLEYALASPKTTSTILKFLWDNKYEIISLGIWTYKKIRELLTKKKEKKNV